MGVNKLLILREPQLQQNLASLLERLESDKGLRQLYTRNPAGVIQQFVFPEQEPIPSAEINRGNRLLYSILTNEAFLTWAREYEQRLIEEATAATEIEDPAAALSAYMTIVDRSRIHSDLAEAVARTADAETIASLTWRPDPVRIGASARLPVAADVAVDIETFIYAVAVAAAFVVAVAAVFLGAVAARPAEALTRIDVQAVANQISDALAQQAGEVRASGALTRFSVRNVGFIR